jgi:hypothetical protein
MAEWRALFTAYTRSSFRLEAQQIYSNPAENERLTRFLAGTAEPPTYAWRLACAQDRLAVGATKTTVRVVVEPPTDYTRMEMFYYPILSAGGEDVRVIAVAEGSWPQGLVDHDYFVFDEQEVWRLHYNSDHTFRGAELVEGPTVLADHLHWRDIALAQAIPLHEYHGVEMITV